MFHLQHPKTHGIYRLTMHQEVGTALCRAFGCVPADLNHQWFDRFDESSLYLIDENSNA